MAERLDESLEALLVRLARAAADGIEDQRAGDGLERFPLREGVVVSAGERCAIGFGKVVGQADRRREAAVERGARRRSDIREDESLGHLVEQDGMLVRGLTVEPCLELGAVGVEQCDTHRDALRGLHRLARRRRRILRQRQLPGTAGRRHSRPWPAHAACRPVHTIARKASRSWSVEAWKASMKSSIVAALPSCVSK